MRVESEQSTDHHWTSYYDKMVSVVRELVMGNHPGDVNMQNKIISAYLDSKGLFQDLQTLYHNASKKQ